MRMSRRMGVYANGKRAVFVSVYGAKKETVTLTHEKGEVFTVSTDDNGYGGVLEIPVGSYTVNGSVSKFSKTTTVDKYTKTVEAWPDSATIYYWYGYAPNGAWSAAASGASHYVHAGNTGTPTCSQGTNSVYFASPGGYSACGTIYLPKTKLSGDTLKIVCSGANVPGYGALLQACITSSVSGTYSPAKYVDISNGTLSIPISTYSGVSYHLAIFGATSNYDGGSRPSSVTIHAAYSTGETKDVERKSIRTTVATNDTYRYGSALQATSGFAKVSSLTFGAINYVGQGTEDYNAMMIPLSGFNFSGSSYWLELTMWVMTSSATNHTFRWALTTSRANESVYKGAGAVTDANQIAQGTFSTAYTSGNYSWQTFLLECENIPANTPLYLYLWRNNTTYGNIHVMDNITVTLEYAKN